MSIFFNKYLQKLQVTIDKYSHPTLKISPCSVCARKKNMLRVLCVAEHTKIIPLSGSSRSFLRRGMGHRMSGWSPKFLYVMQFSEHTSTPRMMNWWLFTYIFLTYIQKYSIINEQLIIIIVLINPYCFSSLTMTFNWQNTFLTLSGHHNSIALSDENFLKQHHQGPVRVRFIQVKLGLVGSG